MTTGKGWPGNEVVSCGQTPFMWNLIWPGENRSEASLHLSLQLGPFVDATHELVKVSTILDI